MADLFEALYDRLDSMGLPLDGADEDYFYIVPGKGKVIGQIIVKRIYSGSGIDVHVEFMDYKRQCLQNGFMDKAVQKSITSMEELIEFCEDRASWDVMDYTLFLTRNVLDVAKDMKEIAFQMERDLNELSKKLSERVNEGMSKRFCHRVRHD